MKRNVFVVTLLALIAVSAFAFHSGTVDAKGNPVIYAVPIHDIGNAVEVAANGLLSQGYEVMQIDRTRAYYSDGTLLVYVWVKGYGMPPSFNPDGGLQGYSTSRTPTPQTDASSCHDYDPVKPGVQGPFPGATCYQGPTGEWGWR